MAEESLTITIDGEEIRDGIPFQLLATVFAGVQNTIYQIAMAESGCDARKRGRVPDDIRGAYQLMRVADHNSAYTVEARFTPAAQQGLLPFETTDRGVVLDKYASLVRALANSDDRTLSAILPDTTWRRRILRTVDSYCPKKGDRWYVAVRQGKEGASVALSATTSEYIDKLLVSPEIEEMTVSGELVRVHLDEHKLGIYYQPTRRVLDCYYDPELEDLILGNLKGIVHVTGRVELDANGYPDRIVDVTAIRALDLRPLVLKSIETTEGKLVLRQAVQLKPSFEDELVVFELPEFHIVAMGDTREAAVDKLYADLIWLWKEYVIAPEEDLSQDAKELAERLRTMVEEASVMDGRAKP